MNGMVCLLLFRKKKNDFQSTYIHYSYQIFIESSIHYKNNCKLLKEERRRYLMSLYQAIDLLIINCVTYQ